MEIVEYIAPSPIATHRVKEAALVNGEDFDGNALVFAPVGRARECRALPNLALTNKQMHNAVRLILYDNITVRGNQTFSRLLRTLLGSSDLRDIVRRLTALDIDRCCDSGSDIEQHWTDQGLTFPNLQTLEFEKRKYSNDPLGLLPEIFWLALRSPKLHTLTLRDCQPTFWSRRKEWIMKLTLLSVKVLYLYSCDFCFDTTVSWHILDLFPNLATLIVDSSWIPPGPPVEG